MAEPLPIALVDIDGVVADVRHRVHFVEQRPKDWGRFFAEAKHDPPQAEGIAVVQRLLEDHEIVYLTGRPEHLRADTEEWLAAHGLGGHRLLMRRSDDRRPSARFKVQAAANLAKRRHIGIVVDDDTSVIAAMKAAGYPTLLADWEVRDAATDASLFDAQQIEGRT
ncbi:MAG: hypothetical protein Q8K63_14580 [Acidimicrobiales bacterium]|nr:hypothetical protein [Acidimicrobiales bacterium]